MGTGMKYFLITFGCQINESDSEKIAAVLEKTEYQPASKIDEADLVVVNMCSVRQSAVDRVYGLMPKFQKLQTINYKLQTILTGCILKKDRKKLAEKFDFIFSIKDLPKLPEILHSGFPLKANNHLKIQPKPHISGLVPIMTGCNNFCAYCVVPYVRGEEISRPAEEIICEIKNLVNPIRNSEDNKKIQNKNISNGVKRGYKEIWLLGQNVNSYNNEQRTPKEPRFRRGPTGQATSNEQKINFPKLLKMVNDIPGEFWIRFTSSHPKDFSDELIETMADCEKVTEYLNLPVQTGDNKILKQMNRHYTVAQYKKLVKKIRKKTPDIALSTDVIVGFPGETKEQFKNTAKLFKDVKFDMAYISKYSPRTRTAAVKLKDNVSQKEKDRRKKTLTEILKETALENNKKYIGKEVEVLVDNLKSHGVWLGKTRTHKNIQFESNKNLTGKFVKVKITDALPWGLKGEL